MKKILIFVMTLAFAASNAGAAVRDGNTGIRGGGATQTAVQKRVATNPKTERTTTPRTTVLVPTRTTTNNSGRGTSARTTINRTINATKNVATRAATTESTTTIETRTGTQYETCKSAFFTCMDQFCALKNDDYRRCSCSNRINSLAASRDVLTSAGEQLTIFTESLDTVGMTAAQATAIRTASDGENALTNDNSASKALLQAIMNSIRGGDTTVGGRYSDLNSINMSFDTSTSFGADNAQIIASYNGQNLYSAVYPQCRNAVRSDCNNASLQRAVTAYLMAIEQDCNTVQTAIEQKQKELKSAIREGSALLDLARVENRKKHNSDDITTCINNVESAILSEEVCGANYHKCLDNGQFIDVATGAPITGVIKFYELGNLLKFDSGTDAATQKLAKMSRNKGFVANFEKRTKNFAKPALDNCTEIADEVWSEYLDKAMLAIYYAQQAKVSEIKQGCFDFVSKCYESSDASITNAMSQLMSASTTILQPDKVTLSTELCTDYVESCNNMFDGNIISQYVATRESADVLSACRAVVKQCFDKYGGAGYENFYYPYSGLFSTGRAPDWFTLYEYNDDGDKVLKSPCARQLTEIPSCNDPALIEKAFGGLDVVVSGAVDISDSGATIYVMPTDPIYLQYYGKLSTDSLLGSTLNHRQLHSVGVATEIYNQIIDTLSTQCANIQGRFIEIQFLQNQPYNMDNYCQWHDTSIDSMDSNMANYLALNQNYGIASNENMCPRDYALSVDTQSWGICSCWGNGGRRSKNGRSATCMPILPTEENVTGDNTPCTNDMTISPLGVTDPKKWCVQRAIDSTNRVCPQGQTVKTINNNTRFCSDPASEDNTQPAYFKALVPQGI